MGLLRRVRGLDPDVLAAVLVATHVLVALALFVPVPFTGGDNAVYLTLAHSLSEYGRYADLFTPGAPPHTQFPPVFPLLVAAGARLGLTGWIGMKLIVLACSAVAVAFTYLWLRGRWPRSFALAVTSIVALAPGIANQAHWELSDVPFWAATMIALWTWERRSAPGAQGIAPTVIAFFTRTAGLPLVVAASVWLVRLRSWRTLRLLALVLLPLAAVWFWRAAIHGGNDYGSAFLLRDPYRPDLGTVGALDVLARIPRNAREYALVHLPNLVFGAANGWSRWLGALLFALGVCGALTQGRRARVAELFLILYLAQLLVWPPVWSGVRLLLPVVPLLLAFGLDLLMELQRFVPRPQPVGAALLALVLLAGVPATWEGARVGAACNRRFADGDRFACLPGPEREFMETAVWARGRLPLGSAVLSRKPSLFYVGSGYPGLLYPMSADTAVFFQHAREAGASYVVLDDLGGMMWRYLAPVVAGVPGAFCTLHRQGDTVLMRILRPEERADAGTSESADLIPCAALGLPTESGPS